MSLTFDILKGRLFGSINGVSYDIPVFSGGGGGSTSQDPGWIQEDVVNNPREIKRKTQGSHSGEDHVHGGPLVPGFYTIETPAHKPGLGFCARLVPAPGQNMHGRGGFYIHGRGAHGSDGCIVPARPHDFHSLMTALTNAGGGKLRATAISIHFPEGLWC